MNAPVRKPRGRPFKPGNPGRPPGSKNKVTRMLEQLVEGQAEQLERKAFEFALAGNMAALRMLLDRVWPLRKGQPVNFVMPPINTLEDVFPAIASIWKALGEGRLTPEEAAALSMFIDRSARAIEVHDITKRVAALEQAREKRDETKRLGRLEALEREEQKELRLFEEARFCIVMIVLAHYVGDLKEDDYHDEAVARALKYPSVHDYSEALSTAEKNKGVSEIYERYQDAYRRLFATVGLDFDSASPSVLFEAFVTMVEQLPDGLLEYAAGCSTIPPGLSSENFLVWND